MRLVAGLLMMVSLLAACATGTTPPISPVSPASLAASLGLDAEILPRVLAAGPWPPSGAQAARDRGNPLSGQTEAILLGQQLFLDPRLSRGGDLACASCHVPGLAYTDGRARALGAGGQRL
ncbi:MAG: di-heme enzyme, partial [Pseudomonadota bacterium]